MEDDGQIPTIFEVFSTLRATRDDLKQAYEGSDHRTFRKAVDNAITVLSIFGDYDEPLCATLKAARDAEGDKGACLELDRLADVSDVIDSIDKRAFDRDDKRVVVGNTVRCVQGELGFDWDMDEPAKIVSIPEENKVVIKWDDDQQLEMASYDVRIDD